MCLKIIKRLLSHDSIRVRFAPSPTGKLHFGGLRTAFYNYLFAKKHNGKFILRIEDTDRTRFQEGAVEHIIESLKWTGIRPDLGPGFSQDDPLEYYQSNRLRHYHEHALELQKNGHAYKCFCDETRLNFIKKNATRNQEKSGYDGKCRLLSQKQIDEYTQQGKSYVIRFKLEDRMIEYEDLVYGHMKANLTQSEGDFVLIKSDGFPVYHFANVVDDHLMAISHVFRGQEWILSTFKHIQLYEAFGWLSPKYAHLPLITNFDGSKLSKRYGAMDILSYREKGYHSDALISYMTTFGGGFKGNIAHKHIDDLIDAFDINHLTTISVKMDEEKLDLLNKYYFKQKCSKGLREMIEKLRDLVTKHKHEVNKEFLTDEYLASILSWAPDRVLRLNDLVEMDNYRYLWTSNYHKDVSILNMDKDKLDAILNHLIKYINNRDFKDSNLVKTELTNEFEQLKIELNLTKTQNLWTITRVLLTGAKEGPPLGDLFITLGEKNLKYRLLNIKNKI